MIQLVRSRAPVTDARYFVDQGEAAYRSWYFCIDLVVAPSRDD